MLEFEARRLALTNAEWRVKVIETELLKQIRMRSDDHDSFSHMSSLFDELQVAIGQLRTLKAAERRLDIAGPSKKAAPKDSQSE